MEVFHQLPQVAYVKEARQVLYLKTREGGIGFVMQLLEMPFVEQRFQRLLLGNVVLLTEEVLILNPRQIFA